MSYFCSTVILKKISRWKKILIFTGIAIVLAVFSRGALFRLLVTYSVTTERPQYGITDRRILDKLEKKLVEENPQSSDELS
jgi:hypothetical protein